MANQEGAVTNLIQGVSQQDPEIRAIGQVQEQVNMRSHTTLGAVSRPGTKLEFQFPADLTVDQDTYFHEYKSGDDKYIVALRPDGMAVFDYSGNYQPLSGGHDTYTAEFKDPALSATYNLSDYLGTAGTDDIAAYTIADTTFVLNKDVEPEVTDDGITSGGTRTFIYIKSVTFGLTYRVYVDVGGVPTLFASVAVPSTKTVAAGSVNLQTIPSTRDIACSLLSQLIASGATSSYLIGDSLIVTVQNATVDDDNAGVDIISFQDSINKYEDLPAIGSVDHVIKIVGDRDAEDEWYVRGTGTRQSVTGSISYTDPVTGGASSVTATQEHVYDFRWDEVAGRGQDNAIDATTMPHLITKTASGFLVELADWEAREAGDSESNPDPKFIGKPIKEIYSYQNRLVLLAGKYPCSSRTDEWFAFWKDTVVVENPANPCFPAADSDVLHASEIAGDLLVFTENSVYRIFGQSEPYTASSPLVRVGSLGTGIYPATTDIGVLIANSSGYFTTVKELVVTGDSRLLLPLDITAHCPYYIEDEPAQILHNTNYNIGFVRTKDGVAPSTALWVYENGKNSTGKQIQQAWHKWVFGDLDTPDIIRTIWIRDDVLYIVLQHTDDGSKIMLYSLPLDPAVTEFLEFRPLLDRMQEVTTEVANPSEADVLCGDDVVCVLTEDGSGVRLNATSSGDRLVIDSQEYIDSPTKVLVGKPIERYVDLSTLFLRRPDGGARTTHRTQLLRMWLSYTRTAYIKVLVTDKAGTTTERYWSAQEDAINGVWDGVALQSGSITVPLRGTNTDVSIRIYSNDYTPMGVTALKFRARYGRKASARAKNTVIS